MVSFLSRAKPAVQVSATNNVATTMMYRNS